MKNKIEVVKPIIFKTNVSEVRAICVPKPKKLIVYLIAYIRNKMI